MDAVTRILILASPGHYRDSLVALLRTIPRADLILSDSSFSEIDSFCRVDPLSGDTSSIVLVDLDSTFPLASSDMDITARLAWIKSSWPRARVIILVDNLQHTREAQRLDADCILPRSISAGEFLMTIRTLDSLNHRLYKPRRIFPLSPVIDLSGSVLSTR